MVSHSAPSAVASCEMPLAMLMDGIEISADGTAILFAAWYWRESLPQTVAERRSIFRHLVIEKRCARLELHGSVEQITQIARGGAYAADMDRKVRSIEELLEIAQQSKGTGLKWENISNPRGTSLSREITVQVFGTAQEIAAHLQDNTQNNIQLHLVPAE